MLLAVMDRKSVTRMVNLTGGRGAGLAETIARFDAPHPGRFVTFTEPWWPRVSEPDYPRFQADEIERAQQRRRARAQGAEDAGPLPARAGHARAARGRSTTRASIRCGRPAPRCKLPVAIHVSDPEAFFLPIDRFNERYEELHAPSRLVVPRPRLPQQPRSCIEARNRVFARHPKTQFVGAARRPPCRESRLRRRDARPLPATCSVEIGARIGELGRQPRAARRFFERYQDRILFGTDAVPNGHETPQQVFGDELYEIYYRFLETEDEYFDYAPAPVPPQGRWRIYGIGLPEAILKKVYHDNAARLLGLDPL